MNINKYLYYLIAYAFFLPVVVYFNYGDIKKIIYSLVAYYLGISVIFEYMKNDVIRFGPFTVKNKGNHMERFFYLCAGVLCVLLSFIFTIKN